MKKIKSISLFFVYTSLIFSVGFFCGEKKISNALSPYEHETQLQNTPFTTQVVTKDSKLSKDTIYIEKVYDMLKDTYITKNISLPSFYIGMNKEEFKAAVEAKTGMTLADETGKNLVSAQVLSFSPRQVVVQKNYKEEQSENSFYLGVVDDEVVVFFTDRRTEYFRTGILLQRFPVRMQREIKHFYYVEDNEMLFDILENYSS